MNLTTKFDLSNVNYAQENVVNLLISAKAPKITLKERKPVNIIKVIDVSGSMHGDKLGYAKKTTMKLIDHLSPVDSLGIVLFDGTVRVLSVPQKMTQEAKDKLKAEVLHISSGGSTNFAGGMIEGLRLAAKVDGDCRVIMLTDGQPTDGATTLEQLSDILRNNMAKNTSLSAFGYGSDHVSSLLTSLADVGKGNYAYIQNPDDALAAFARELGGLLSCYGQNLKFKLTANEGVKIREVLSDVNVEQIGDEIKVSIPDLYSEETRHLLVELLLPIQKKVFPRPVLVAEVDLEYDDAQTGKPQKVQAKAKITYVRPADVKTDVDSEVATQLGIVRLHKAQIKAQEYAKSGNFAAAQDCFMNLDLERSGVEVQGARDQLSSYYVNSASFASNNHAINSAMYATKSGRSSGMRGMSLNKMSHDNSMQEELVRSFTQDQSGAGGAGGQQLGSAGVVPSVGQSIITDPVMVQALAGLAGVTVTTAQNPLTTPVMAVVKEEEDSEKKISKKRSTTEW